MSVWLQDGVSGVGAHAGISVNDSSTGFNVQGAYSHLGVIDIAVGLEYATYKQDSAIASDLGSYAGALGLQYHPLKQGPQMPISLGLGVGGSSGMLTSSQLDDAGISGSLWGVVGNVEAYRFVKLAPTVGVTPSISLQYAYSQLSLKNTFDNEITTSDSQFSVGLTSYFGFLGSNGMIYGIAPTLNLGEHVSFSVYFGLIWPLKR